MFDAGSVDLKTVVVYQGISNFIIIILAFR
jgi:hypothetical protein